MPARFVSEFTELVLARARALRREEKFADPSRRLPPAASRPFPRARGNAGRPGHERRIRNFYGLVGAGAAGLPKSTAGAVEIDFSFSTETFALVL